VFLSWLESAEVLNVEDPYFICIGDDETDEDMFKVAGPNFMTIKVGPGLTQAEYRIEKQEQVLETLERLFVSQPAAEIEPVRSSLH
jgi:trehalose 6-phosphate synthase/phosphatase